MAMNTLEKMPDYQLIKPIVNKGRGAYLLGGLLFAIFVWTMYMYSTQLSKGLGVTGMNRPISWGFYIVNFVFFIGISHDGTPISALLRLSKAEWRRTITGVGDGSQANV